MSARRRRKARAPDWRRFCAPYYETEADIASGERVVGFAFTGLGTVGALRIAAKLALLGGHRVADIAALRVQRQHFWVWQPEGPPPPREPDWAALATPRWRVEVRLADGQRFEFKVSIAEEREARAVGFAIARLLLRYPLAEIRSVEATRSLPFAPGEALRHLQSWLRPNTRPDKPAG